MNQTLDYEGLLAEPPELRTRVHALPDGRTYTLYDLPASVIDRVYQMSQKGNLPVRSAAEVAAQALLGKPPAEEETRRLLDTLGADTILGIFRNALSAATLNEANVDEAKKP